jgi:hypothetical protein
MFEEEAEPVLQLPPLPENHQYHGIDAVMSRCRVDNATNHTNH